MPAGGGSLLDGNAAWRNRDGVMAAAAHARDGVAAAVDRIGDNGPAMDDALNGAATPHLNPAPAPA